MRPIRKVEGRVNSRIQQKDGVKAVWKEGCLGEREIYGGRRWNGCQSQRGTRGDAPNTKEAQDERRDHFRGLRTPNTVPNFGTGAAKMEENSLSLI